MDIRSNVRKFCNMHIERHGSVEIRCGNCVDLKKFGQDCFEAGRKSAFDSMENVKIGPCYSSGLPCGCVADAIKAAKEG